MLYISDSITIPANEIHISAIRAMGSGGQNVNKVSSAIHLRFDIAASCLPEKYQQRLLNSNDSRITKDGILVLKSQSYRTQEMNKQEALRRLQAIIQETLVERKIRKARKPSFSSIKKRLDDKKRSSVTKRLRRKVDY